jgi:dienelactone hydrolase
MTKSTLIISLLLLFSWKNEAQNKTITFPSKDGLLITADVYNAKETAISILLCHQAGYSRGEYKDTAVELTKLGYSVMAIDQRSGNKVNNIKNETKLAASKKGLGVSYLDAKQDIEAAIDYIYKQNGGKKILLVGSSYSASLSLLIGVNNSKVKAVAAFSPGEYFKSIDINKSISTYKKPVFVTSSLNESKKVKVLIDKIDPSFTTHFIPEVKGIHGSRALWKTTNGYEAYWSSFKSFIASLK